MTKRSLREKVGMTQIFTEAGEFIPVLSSASQTLCFKVKTVETDGCKQFKLVFDDKRSEQQTLTRPRGNNTAPYFIREFKKH